MNKSLQLAQDIAEAYNNLGTFCDEQYTHILNYMNSKDFEDKKAILEQISEDVKIIKDQGMLSTFFFFENKIEKNLFGIMNTNYYSWKFCFKVIFINHF